MRAQHVKTIAGVATAVLLSLVAACGEEEPTMDPGADGAVAAVRAFAEALEANDAPRACAQLTATAQRALERAQGANECITAVGRAAEGAPSASAISTEDVEVSGSRAIVSGADAEALARLFGSDSLGLQREDERWLIK